MLPRPRRGARQTDKATASRQTHPGGRLLSRAGFPPDAFGAIPPASARYKPLAMNLIRSRTRQE